jgi:hypothetical protein
MQIYDALIIGCGYASVGFAQKNKNVIICEEHQICDTGFYLPARCYEHFPYCAKTAEGKRLENFFTQLSLFLNGQQNLNGFECALCGYLVENPTEILLKCRIVDIKRGTDGFFDVSIYTNEGITHLLAKSLINAKGSGFGKKITVLFTTDNFESEKEKLLSAFPGAEIERAFYNERYAIHIKADGFDENSVKLWIYKKWCEIESGAKILYIAPVLYGDGDGQNPLCDANYKNPIEAFEAGYLLLSEDKK